MPRWFTHTLGTLALLFVLAGGVGAETRPEQGLAAEFMRHVEAAFQTKDPEAQIAAAQEALKLEAQMSQWLLDRPRDAARGVLLGMLGEAYRKRLKGNHADNLERAMTAFEQSVRSLQRENFPEEWADSHDGLGAVCLDRQVGVRSENLECAIRAFEAALTVWSPKASPDKWLHTNTNLGISYFQRVKGHREENLERSVAAHKAALAVLSKEDSPENWATLKLNIGTAYEARSKGTQSENVESAIAAYQEALSVLRRERAPDVWAKATFSIGSAYLKRVLGSRAENLERAISALSEALKVWSREGAPFDWAKVQNDLGIAYAVRIVGSRAENRERAIAAYEAALSVFAQATTPHQWAETQNNLAIANMGRVAGTKPENMRRAVEGFEAAQKILTRRDFPERWAGVQNNIGIALTRSGSSMTNEQHERGIGALEAALSVRTRNASPVLWAETQDNLGIAYLQRRSGDKRRNIELAIASFERALIVRAREVVPDKWAATQTELGRAYRALWSAGQGDGLVRAISAFEAALAVYRRDAFPREHLRVVGLLAGSRFESGQRGLVVPLYKQAREALLALVGQGLDEVESRDLINQFGALPVLAAFSAAEAGNREAALSYLSDGNAQLMALTLRRNALDLSPEKRVRHDSLKFEIRELARLVEESVGVARTKALDRLATLRRELSALIEVAGASEPKSFGVAKLWSSLVPQGGAIVAPIVTQVGGKLLIVTERSGAATIGAVDLPKLTMDRLQKLILGDDPSGEAGGWLGSFSVQNLPSPERERRIGEWLGAIESIGPDLWSLVAGALEKALNEQGVKDGARVVLMPTAELGLLPLGLAQESKSHRRLIEAYEIVIVPNFEALAAATLQVATPPPRSLAAIVNPTGDIARLDLPFTEIEGALVARHFVGRPLIRLDKANATPKVVLAALKGKSYWHFSSHGFFDWSDARLSGLLMREEQPLTVGQLLDSDGGFGRPRLVVLSACESGLYDIGRNPNEFIGLPATFMQLGATGVVSTLWQVDDLATALLIAKFYDLHFDDALTPSLALKRAQVWLRDATKAELIAFSNSVAEKARLEPKRLAELQSALGTRTRGGGTRFSATWNSIHERVAAGITDRLRDSENLKMRPFAHPYYWGGFVYTGL